MGIRITKGKLGIIGTSLQPCLIEHPAYSHARWSTRSAYSHSNELAIYSVAGHTPRPHPCTLHSALCTQSPAATQQAMTCQMSCLRRSGQWPIDQSNASIISVLKSSQTERHQLPETGWLGERLDMASQGLMRWQCMATHGT